MISLKEKYNKEVVPEMMKKFELKSKMAVPRISKVVLNVGIGKRIADMGSGQKKKVIDNISNDLAKITGQKPVVTKVKKSISGFKIRKGMESGISVVLREQKMLDFLMRLIHVVFPRTRDFTGLNPDSVDREGNFSLGIEEQVSFPEILPENVYENFGLGITVVTTTQDREEGLALLKLLGFPFKKDNKEDK
jgi:large subunit ribosomal protein L5